MSIALEHQSALRIRCRDREVNGRSILELMTLEAATGAELELLADGPDADELLDRLASLIDAGFEERN